MTPPLRDWQLLRLHDAGLVVKQGMMMMLGISQVDVDGGPARYEKVLVGGGGSGWVAIQ